MNKLKLDNIQQWIGTELIEKINIRRKKSGEIARKRKLGTTEVFWLFLNVALYSATINLHGIIKLAIADLNLNQKWTVSVPAFCQARMRFSPQAPLCNMGTSRQKIGIGICHKTKPVAWIPA